MDHRHERSPVRIQGSDHGMRRSIEAMFSDFKTGALASPEAGSKSRIDWSGSYRFRQSLCTGPFQPGQKKNTLSRNAAKKGGPESSTIPVFLFRAGLRTIRRSRGLCQNTQAPGGVDKLKGGKHQPHFSIDKASRSYRKCQHSPCLLTLTGSSGISIPLDQCAGMVIVEITWPKGPTVPSTNLMRAPSAPRRVRTAS